MPDTELQNALAAEIRRSVMVLAVRAVTPDRRMETVLERIDAVGFMIDDPARWIVSGEHRPYCKRID